jgi:hypothetical protein
VSTLVRIGALVATACIVGGCASTDRMAGGAAAGPPFDALAWLAGAWAGTDASGVVTEEHWTSPRGNTMFGVNRTIAGDETVFFEFLRIERDDDGLVYLAAPRGRAPATPFRLIESDGTRLVFENPGHDFPQRIIYDLQADGVTLELRIEGTDDGGERSSRWRLQRVDAGVRGRRHAGRVPSFGQIRRG